MQYLHTNVSLNVQFVKAILVNTKKGNDKNRPYRFPFFSYFFFDFIISLR